MEDTAKTVETPWTESSDGTDASLQSQHASGGMNSDFLTQAELSGQDSGSVGNTNRPPDVILDPETGLPAADALETSGTVGGEGTIGGGSGIDDGGTHGGGTDQAPSTQELLSERRRHAGARKAHRPARNAASR